VLHRPSPAYLRSFRPNLLQICQDYYVPALNLLDCKTRAGLQGLGRVAAAFESDRAPRRKAGNWRPRNERFLHVADGKFRIDTIKIGRLFVIASLTTDRHVAQDSRQPVDRVRFSKEAKSIRPLVDQNVAVAARQDDLQIRPLNPDRVTKFDSTYAGHDDIREHQIESVAVLPESFDSAFAVADPRHSLTEFSQHPRGEFADSFIFLDE
jgi:hypothetical protein